MLIHSFLFTNKMLIKRKKTLIPPCIAIRKYDTLTHIYKTRIFVIWLLVGMQIN